MRAHMRACVCVRACMWVSVSFPPIYNMFPGIQAGIQEVPRPLIHNIGVCSCLFGSRTFWLHTMMFQNSTYISVWMSVFMCVFSSACLHRCMFMSRTHNTHIHAHTTQTPGQVSMYASFETMSRGTFMCNVHCAAQICYSWHSLRIEGAGVRNYLSLSDRRGTTS